MNGFERNLYFRNEGKQFRHLAAVSGLDSVLDSRSHAAADIDRDGDLDVVVKNLQRRLLQCFRNDIANREGNTRAFFQFVGEKSNRDGVGTRIEISSSGNRQMAEVRSAHGFQSQGPNEVFFGLGKATSIDTVEVFWPSGDVQSFQDLEADTFYTIHERDGIIDRKALNRKSTTALAEEAPYREVERQRIFSVVRPAAKIEVQGFDGDPIATPTGPRLVCLLTSWLPSLEEQLGTLREISELHPDLQIDLLVVTSELVGASAEGRAKIEASGLRAAECDYRLAAIIANQSNVLFPSAFLIREGNVVLDLIGKFDIEQAGAAIQSALLPSR